MRRLALIALALVAGAAWLATSASGDQEEQRYWVELDNAFGLIEGGDVKVSGVRAGKIKTMEVDRRTFRARVEIDIDKTGFGSLRDDVFCESRPQSLIGEYFLDCLPGTSKKVLRPGSTIPVEKTGSTVPVDLVNNIMRRPFRERFSILLGELGAAFAGRGTDLNETIRRLSPALRETDKVLAILADQRHIIRNLTADAENVLTRLAANRRDVSRFIVESRDTAKASASQAHNIQAQFQRLPPFLRELRPTLGALEEAADGQIPALHRLNENAGRLKAFFDALGPFAEASRPATRTLAGAAKTGRGTVKAARPRIAELRQFARQAPETARNLTFALEDVDNRDRAVERDPRSPGGRGYTGLEAILQYVFNQSQAVNLFDNESYILKASAFFDPTCANYTNAQQARQPQYKKCSAALGPNQPGINQPDPSPRAQSASRADDRGEGDILEAARRAAGPAPAAGGGGGQAPQPSAPAPRRSDSLAETLGGLLGGLPDVKLPDVRAPAAPNVDVNRTPRQDTAAGLLGYFLAP
jgi:phospholipid/cholesterol/gamma-HCH transport system substrate-binding protein